MVAVSTEEGYSIFELLGSDSVEVEDLVSWQDDTSLGHTILKNISQEETFEVYFQNHHVPQSQLNKQLDLA